MKKVSLASIFIFLAAAVFPLSVVVDGSAGQNASQTSITDLIQLPNPRYDSGTSVEKALNSRRSVRSFVDEPLSLSDISQILWAAQGITKRTDAPPLEVESEIRMAGRISNGSVSRRSLCHGSLCPGRQSQRSLEWSL